MLDVFRNNETVIVGETAQHLMCEDKSDKYDITIVMANGDKHRHIGVALVVVDAHKVNTGYLTHELYYNPEIYIVDRKHITRVCYFGEMSCVQYKKL